MQRILPVIPPPDHWVTISTIILHIWAGVQTQQIQTEKGEKGETTAENIM